MGKKGAKSPFAGRAPATSAGARAGQPAGMVLVLPVVMDAEKPGASLAALRRALRFRVSQRNVEYFGSEAQFANSGRFRERCDSCGLE